MASGQFSPGLRLKNGEVQVLLLKRLRNDIGFRSLLHVQGRPDEEKQR